MSLLKTQNLLIDTRRKSLSILSSDGTVFDQDIAIAPLTWAVLHQLVSHAPDRVSIDKLIELCWENAVVSDETVVQRIALLRKTLEKHGAAPSSIESVRGVGYRWVSDVFEVPPDEEPFLPLPDVRKTRLVLWSTFLVLFLLISLYHWNDMEVLVTPRADPVNIAENNFEEMLQQAHSYRQRFDVQSMQFAVSLYQKVLQQEPDNVSALAGLTFSLCHQVSKFNEAQGHHDDIAYYAYKALQLAPEDPFVLQANGLARDVIGDIDGAIDFYTKALELNAEEPSLYGDLAYLYTVKGELALAAEFHFKSLAGVQQFRQSQLALWLHLLGEENSAGYWYEHALLLNPHNLTDKLSYLDWLLKSAQFSRAIIYANDLQEQGLEDYRLSLLLAKVYFLSSHQVKASNTIRATLKLQPDQAEGLLWLRIIDGSTDLASYPDPVWQYYSGLQYPWPEHLVTMAINQHHGNQISANQKTRTDDTQQVLHYLTKAIEQGYRDSEWLQLLVLKNVLPDVPEIMQLMSEIKRLRDTENQKLEQNADYQDLLNRTARAIVN